MSMLGHVLRLDDDTPPRKAMESYLAHTGPSKRGRPLTILATTIKPDLAGKDIAMENKKDLQTLREMTGDKHAWSLQLWK